MILQGAKEFGLMAGTEPVQGKGDGAPNPNPLKPSIGEKKPKKPPSMKKQVSSKITMVGTKITDLKVMKSKVEQSALFLGYQFCPFNYSEPDCPIYTTSVYIF